MPVRFILSERYLAHNLVYTALDPATRDPTPPPPSPISTVPSFSGIIDGVECYPEQFAGAKIIIHVKHFVIDR